MSQRIVFKPQVAGFYGVLGIVGGIVFGYAGLWLTDYIPVWAGLTFALGGFVCCFGPIAAVASFGLGYTMLVRKTYYGGNEE